MSEYSTALLADPDLCLTKINECPAIRRTSSEKIEAWALKVPEGFVLGFRNIDPYAGASFAACLSTREADAVSMLCAYVNLGERPTKNFDEAVTEILQRLTKTLEKV